MDSIFEKITLYDVLGYFVPGSLVMLAVCGIFLSSADNGVPVLYRNYQSLFVYGFILVSYIIGILLSEISRRIMEHGRGNGDLPIADKVIEQALIKAGVIASQDDRSEADRNEGFHAAKYLKLMYNDIQSDSNYKRLHNYASAEVLYKNLALAIPVGAIALCIYFPKCLLGKAAILALGILGMKIAWDRCKRFYQKKQDYAVCCYVEKYCRQQK